MASPNTPPTGFSFEQLQPFGDLGSADFGSVLSNLGQPDRTWEGLQHVGLEQTPLDALGNSTTPTGDGGTGTGDGSAGNPGGGPIGAPPGSMTNTNIGDTGVPDQVLSGGLGDGTTGGIGTPAGSLFNTNIGDTGVPDQSLSGSLTPGGDLAVPGPSGVVTGAGGTPVSAGIGSLSSADIGAMNQQLAFMGMAPLTAVEVSALTGIPGGGGNEGGGGPGPDANPSPVAEGIDTSSSPAPATGVAPAGGIGSAGVSPTTDAPLATSTETTQTAEGKVPISLTAEEIAQALEAQSLQSQAQVNQALAEGFQTGPSAFGTTTANPTGNISATTSAALAAIATTEGEDVNLSEGITAVSPLTDEPVDTPSTPVAPQDPVDAPATAQDAMADPSTDPSADTAAADSPGDGGDDGGDGTA